MDLWSDLRSDLEEDRVEHLKELFQDNRFKVDDRDSKGRTPLHVAAYHGSKDCIEFLAIEAKADWTLTTSHGDTAAHIASRFSMESQAIRTLGDSILFVLRAANAASPAPAKADATPENVLKKYLNQRNLKGETCFHMAAKNRFGRDDIVFWLLKHGADPDIANSAGETIWDSCNSPSSPMLGLLSTFLLQNANQAAAEGYEWFRNTNLDSKPVDGGRPAWNTLQIGMPQSNLDLIENFWFYIPVNRRTLIWALLRKLTSDRDGIEELERINVRLFSKEVQEALAPYEVENMRIREPMCAWESQGCAPMLKSTGYAGPWSEEVLSLVMPYFYSKEVDALEDRKADFAMADASTYQWGDSKVKDLYLPLTLDEYCKPALSQADLDGLNNDQTLVRRKRPRLLMVHQVWLWKIDNVVITAFPREVCESKKVFDQSLSEISNLRNPFWGIGSLLSQLIDTINRPTMAGLSEPVLNSYENAITQVSRNLDNYIKTTTLEDTRVQDIKVKKEIDFYHDIHDIREELALIKSVVLQQEDVWKDFTSGVWPTYWSDGQNRAAFAEGNNGFPESRRSINRIARTQRHIEQLKKRIEQLDGNAERIEKRIEVQLDLKSKRASMKETHVSAIMTTAVFGFTIITIIFTPLGFIISLFGLPLEGFKKEGTKEGETDKYYTTTYFGGWAALTEVVVLVLTGLAMWAAVRYGLKLTWRDLFGKEKEDDEPGAASTPGPAPENAGKDTARKATSPAKRRDPNGKLDAEVPAVTAKSRKVENIV